MSPALPLSASHSHSIESDHLLSNVHDSCWDLEASTSISSSEDHSYVRPNRAKDARAPCPGLNTLANHGYIPRSGRNITFIPLLRAIMEVYNLSVWLALIMTVPGFLIYGQFQIHWGTHSTVNDEKSSSPRRCRIPSIPSISYTLTLSSLSSFGPGLRIAHRASLVHPDHPSDRPDSTMLWGFLSFAQSHSSLVASSDDSLRSTPLSASISTIHPSTNPPNGGLTVYDLAFIRVARESTLLVKNKLDSLHEQVALGESALTWLLFAKDYSEGDNVSIVSSSSVIPLSYLAQWFGEERLPDGWTRPAKAIGVFHARRVAAQVQKDMEVISWMYGLSEKV